MWKYSLQNGRSTKEKNMHFLSIAVNQFIELATSGIFIQEKEMQEVQKK